MLKFKCLILLLFISIGSYESIASVPDSLRAQIKKEHILSQKTEMYLELGDYWKNKNTLEASKAYRLALIFGGKANDKVLKAKAQLGCGIMKVRANEFDSAQYYYDNALETFKVQKLAVEQARVLNSIGLLCFYRGNYKVALEFINQGVDLCKEDQELIVMLNNNKSLILKKIGDYKGALSCAYGALKLSKQINDSLGMSKIQGNIGLLHEQLGNDSMAIDFFNQSLEIRKKIGNRKGLAYPLHNLGLIYEEAKDYDKALEYYLKSLEIKQEFNDKRGIARSFNNIGIIYKDMGYFQKALHYYEQSLKLKKEIGLYSGVPHTLNNFGVLYQELKNYTMAIEYYNKALDSTKIDVSVREELTAYKGLYYCNKMQNKMNRALYFLEKVRDVEYEQFNETSSKEIARLETMYNIREVELKNKQLLNDTTYMQSKVKMQYIIAIVLIFCLLLVVIIAVINYQKKKQKERTNQRLTEVNNRLVQLTQFKDTMTSMIVHDLKNPLNTIVNIAAISDFVKRDEHIKDSAGRMLNLVNNILDINRYENDKIVLKVLPCSFLDVIDIAVSEVLFFASSKNISIAINREEDFVVEVDKEIIKRVLVNLLTNAIKYSPLNGSIHIKVDKETNHLLRCVVTDEGEGIDDKIKDSVFEIYKSEGVDRGGVKSNGLGLAFSKIAVEAHNGEIGMDVKETGKTKFWFSLPYKHCQGLRYSNQTNQVENIKSGLSIKEQTKISDEVEVLAQLEVFRVSEILNLIKTIEVKEDSNLEIWLNNLQIAVTECNQDKYSGLLKMAKGCNNHKNSSDV